jgi:polyphosphate kinase
MTAPTSPVRAEHYLNRELSWLNFNARVLAEAQDARTPLLERLKFAAIFSTNLDEFYMVRVAGLRRKVAAQARSYPPEDRSPLEQLDAIRARVRELLSERNRLVFDELLPALGERGVRLVSMESLTPSEAEQVSRFFEAEVFPVLTPLAVDPGHPFPYISNLSLSLAVEVRDPGTGSVHFARVKVPRTLPRWVPIGRPLHFVPIEEVIEANLGALFPGMDVLRWHEFRITRYSDLDLGQIDQPEDLLQTIEEQVFQRRFGEVVRLEVETGMPEHLIDLLLSELGQGEGQAVAPLTRDDVHDSGPILELGDLLTLASLDVPELRDPPFAPVVPADLRDSTRSIFDLMRERDLLVHHPFESFSQSVEAFLEAAAADDHVLAIKITLYRTSGDTAIVRALQAAAENGKQVAVLIELQARFDEANNIRWARQMESFGIHVAYGLPGLKTHGKVALVVRRDADGLRRYVHVGTGNYNSRTARIYTDIGLFTCDPRIGADVTELFNSLTGHSRQRSYRTLLVAPANMREGLLSRISREAEHARAGRPARIIAKMNALVDPQVIAALYEASQAGVEIDLIVRGICCLRPGVQGVSDRIRVLSVIGRFLEHSRMCMFANGGNAEYLFGSADWMPRNLDRRVEVMVPILDRALQGRVQAVLDTCLADDRQAWVLQRDGSYVQRAPDNGAVRGTHALLMRDAWAGAVRAARRAALESLTDEAVTKVRRTRRAKR